MSEPRPTGSSPTGCDLVHDFVIAGYSARSSSDGGAPGGRIADLAQDGIHWVGPTYHPPTTHQGAAEQAESLETGLCRIQSLFLTRTVTDPRSPAYHGPPGSVVQVADVNAAGNDEIADADDQQLTAWADQLAGQVRAIVADPTQNDSVGAWYLTAEELRYWEPGEVKLAELASAAVRAADPRKRPFFTYAPQDSDTHRLEQFTPFFDVVSMGVYPHYNRADEQRTAVPYAVQQMATAASAAGSVKVLPVLEMYEATGDPLTPAERARLPVTTLHDAAAAICNGAGGFLIWSFGDRAGFDSYQDFYEAWVSTIATIRRTGLDVLAVRGTVRDAVPVKIATGPGEAPYTPVGLRVGPAKVPSVSEREWSMDGRTYVLLVNSAEQQVSVTVSGLPAVRFEDSVRGVPVGSGPSLSTTLPPLGVVLLASD